MSEFDIVIPVGPNDTSVIREQLQYTIKHIIGYRNIYLISKLPLEIAGCISISEVLFPFTMETVANYHGESNRNGWYLQQLLKLYSGSVIPEILETYLVLDSDTFFLKPTRFLENGTGLPLYNYGTEYHMPYFNHMIRLHPEFKKVEERSGICHHMIFQKKYIDEIFSLVESHHGVTFYEAFLRQVAQDDFMKSGASEYELYFNYMLDKHPDKIKIRNLIWQNVPRLTNNGINDYVSVHWYMRSKN
jgi:uncharacterized short protein YbdD (DUF466 family)